MSLLTRAQAKKLLVPRRGLLADLLQQPYIIVGHKGAEGVVPEHTIEGYDYGLANGSAGVDIDVRLLSDGEFADVHDATITRTLTGGTLTNVIDHSTHSWRRLAILPAATLGTVHGYPADMRSPVLSDHFRRYGNQWPLWIESKLSNSTDVTAIVNKVIAAGLKDSVIIQAASLNALAPAVAAGMYCQVVNDTSTPAQVVAAGVQGQVFSKTVSDATITAAIAAGIRVGVYNLGTRYERDYYIALGAWQLVTADPAYLSSNTALRTTSPFATGMWFPGMTLAANSRGEMKADGSWGLITAGNNTSTLHGYLGPLPTTGTFTIDLTIKILAAGASSTADVFIHIGPTDQFYKDNIAAGGYTNGHRLYLSKGGTLAIKQTSAPSTIGAAISAFATTALVDGTVVQLRITQSAGSLKIQRLDDGSNGVATVNTPAYSGAYGGSVHLGQNGLNNGLLAEFGPITRA